MDDVSEVGQEIAEAAFRSFLKWVAAQPDAEVVQAQLQLVNDALDRQSVNQAAVREAVNQLIEMARSAPYAEIIVQTFVAIRAVLEERGC